MDIGLERKAFEKVFTQERGWDLTFELGWYQSNSTASAFEGWLAAKGHALPEWISVDDKMPEKDQEVIARYYGGQLDGMLETCFCSGEENPKTVFFRHWMPLPKLPKAQGQKR